jgi:hypothetical protein
VPHPTLTESRQQSLTLARLLASLRLPSGEEEVARSIVALSGAPMGLAGWV